MRLPLPPPPARVRAAIAASISCLLVLVIAANERGQAQTQTQAHGQEINKPFVNPDVKAFVKRFESDEREVYTQRAAIVAALPLKRGMTVADIGAGTGFFSRLFAETVGPEGRIYAVDVSPAFLKHIEAEAKRLGQAQIQTVVATQESTGLPVGSIDLAFLCDVYHHLEQPAKTLASIRRAVRDGGQLVVIDFDRVPGKSSEFVLKHVRAEKSVFITEIQAAGFERIPVTNPPALKETFFLRFRKPGSVRVKPTGPAGE
jgi:ubiquinone/menaquinone biosynthesis C-methylase UbiE